MFCSQSSLASCAATEVTAAATKFVVKQNLHQPFMKPDKSNGAGGRIPRSYSTSRRATQMPG